MRKIISRGRVLDPACGIDKIADIVIENESIVEISEKPIMGDDVSEIIDASGKLVVPGLIDMHVHLREPGHEYKETIFSGCMAAAAGGFTAVCSMPNTNPVNDSRQVTEYILARAKSAGVCRVHPVGSISKNLKGEQLSEYGELKDAGVIALSDDGKPVISSRLMRRAMEYANAFDLLIISHCEDPDLSSGVMNEGALATQMGLSGIPNAAESIMVMRDIALCELTEARLHIAHVSTAESVCAIREAKQRGVPVTAETAPHYFTLTEEAVTGYNTHAKMNPPLRGDKDRLAIRAGLADGTIDAIATDHAPHSVLEKDSEFDFAANGIIGLETSLGLSLKLVEQGVLSLNTLIEKMSINPARILGLPVGLKPGHPADITIIDLHHDWTVNSKEFKSLSRNTPFDGYKLTGRAVMTMINGKTVGYLLSKICLLNDRKNVSGNTV